MAGSRFRKFFSLVVTSLITSLSCAAPGVAVPLEKFEQTMEVQCEGPSTCARSLRSKTALGSYTGIAWRGVGEGKGTFTVKEGVMGFTAAGRSVGTLTLTWDGDTSAEQLSGAGLGCLDVRRGGATALVFSGVSIQGRCSAEEGAGCQPFVVETRLYDFADPTGQTYSASMLRRSNEKPVSDIVVPFSNLNRSGPRGAGRLECVGAISVTVRMDRYSDVTISMGPIFTNSEDPLAVPPTPTPTYTAVIERPTVIVEVQATKVAETPTPVLSPTPRPFAPEGAASPTPAPIAAKDGALKVPALEQAIIAPRDRTAAIAEPTPREEEVVYGQVVGQ